MISFSPPNTICSDLICTGGSDTGICIASTQTLLSFLPPFLLSHCLCVSFYPSPPPRFHFSSSSHGLRLQAPRGLYKKYIFDLVEAIISLLCRCIIFQGRSLVTEVRKKKRNSIALSAFFPLLLPQIAAGTQYWSKVLLVKNKNSQFLTEPFTLHCSLQALMERPAPADCLIHTDERLYKWKIGDALLELIKPNRVGICVFIIVMKCSYSDG